MRDSNSGKVLVSRIALQTHKSCKAGTAVLRSKRKREIPRLRNDNVFLAVGITWIEKNGSKDPPLRGRWAGRPGFAAMLAAPADSAGAPGPTGTTRPAQKAAATGGGALAARPKRDGRSSAAPLRSEEERSKTQ